MKFPIETKDELIKRLLYSDGRGGICVALYDDSNIVDEITEDLRLEIKKLLEEKEEE